MVILATLSCSIAYAISKVLSRDTIQSENSCANKQGNLSEADLAALCLLPCCALCELHEPCQPHCVSCSVTAVCLHKLKKSKMLLESSKRQLRNADTASCQPVKDSSAAQAVQVLVGLWEWFSMSSLLTLTQVRNMTMARSKPAHITLLTGPNKSCVPLRSAIWG